MVRSAHHDNPYCDIRFFFGATEEIHLHTLRELWTGESEELQRLKKRCCGLKLYLDHSTGDQKAGADVIEEAFKLCAELSISAVGHCEDSEINQKAKSEIPTANNVADHSRARPAESEAKAIEYALTLAKKYGTHFHVAHLSTARGLELVRSAKKSGIAITCEVAPHHLFLSIDDYEELGTLAKMNPPLRTRADQEALWRGIADGTVDCIATDHAPHTLAEKRNGYPLNAPSGVPGVETMLPLLMSVVAGKADVMLSGAKHDKGRTFFAPLRMTNSDILRLCFTNPNRIFGLGKQGIVEGAPANLVLVDPKKEWVIKGKELHSKCGWSPYEGWVITGKIVQVITY